jgi:hypothetical protein
MATSKMDIKCKPLTISEMDGIPHVSHNKFAGKLGIPVRKVADKMLQLSDEGGNVLRLLQST